MKGLGLLQTYVRYPIHLHSSLIELEGNNVTVQYESCLMVPRSVQNYMWNGIDFLNKDRIDTLNSLMKLESNNGYLGYEAGYPELCDEA
jgi:hypothetical protein